MPINRDKLIEDLAKRFEPEIAAAFRDAIASIVDNVVLKDIVDAITAGRYEQAVEMLGITGPAFEPLTEKITEAFTTGGRTLAATMPRTGGGEPLGVRSVFRFDVRNERAENWLRQHSSQLVTRLTDESRTSVRSALESGMIAGRNPRSTALDIVGRIDTRTGRRTGGIVGLTQPQERWVRNARAELRSNDPAQLEIYLTRRMRDKRYDRYVTRAINDGTAIPADVQAKMIGRYSDNALRLRGEMIGRTESIETLNRAQWETYAQAVEQGSIKKTSKEWDSAGDQRVRDSHRDLDGKSVPLDQPFIDENGNAMMFPGDKSLGADGSATIACRCRIRYRIDFFSGLT